MRTSIDVLVVDDSDLHADLTIAAVRAVVLTANVVRLKDGDQALQFLLRTGGFATRTPQMPRLILLEVEMPNTNGLTVLDQLRVDPSTRHIPVVLFTVVESPVAIVTAYQLGAKGYVVKPADPEKYSREVGSIARRWLLSSNNDKS